MILSEERGLLDYLRKKKPWEDGIHREAVTLQSTCGSPGQSTFFSHCDHSPLKCPNTRKRGSSIPCIKEIILNIHMIFVGNGCSIREYNNRIFYRIEVLLR